MQHKYTELEYPKLDLASTFMGKGPDGVYCKKWFPFAAHASSVTKRDLIM